MHDGQLPDYGVLPADLAAYVLLVASRPERGAPPDARGTDLADLTTMLQVWPPHALRRHRAVLELLATAGAVSVRQRLAASVSVAAVLPSLRVRLLEDPDPHVRASAAETYVRERGTRLGASPTADDRAVLWRLATDPAAPVQRVLAPVLDLLRPDHAEAFLSQLTPDAVPPLMCNPTFWAGPESPRLLAQARDVAVRVAFATALDAPIPDADHTPERERAVRRTMQLLARDDACAVGVALAGSRRIAHGEATLERLALARHPCETVRLTLLANRGALAAMEPTEARSFFDAVLDHPEAASRTTIGIAAARTPVPPGHTDALVARLLRDPEPSVWAALAAHGGWAVPPAGAGRGDRPVAPSPTVVLALWRLATVDDPATREALAGNPDLERLPEVAAYLYRAGVLAALSPLRASATERWATWAPLPTPTGAGFRSLPAVAAWLATVAAAG